MKLLINLVGGYYMDSKFVDNTINFDKIYEDAVSLKHWNDFVNKRKYKNFLEKINKANNVDLRKKNYWIKKRYIINSKVYVRYFKRYDDFDLDFYKIVATFLSSIIIFYGLYFLNSV
jgi:hypothetical protein